MNNDERNRKAFEEAARNGSIVVKDDVDPTLQSLNALYKKLGVPKRSRFNIIDSLRKSIEGGKAHDQHKRLKRVQSLLDEVDPNDPK